MDSPLFQLKVHSDSRGSLVAIEGGHDLPFEIRRVYYIFGVDGGTERGFHAHRELRQLMICTSGSCTIALDDGAMRKDYRLDNPSTALFVDRMVWREMRDFTVNSVLLVLASEPFDRDDYIYCKDEFRAELAMQRGKRRSELTDDK